MEAGSTSHSGGSSRRIAEVCVLASGSAGNCTVVRVGGRAFLIDAGLSPRRTTALLRGLGIELCDVEAVVLTHLDTDHASPAWRGELPPKATLFVHRRHLGRSQREGFDHRRVEPFEGEFSPCDGAFARPILMAHDSLGVAAFRFEFARRSPRGAAHGSLGFATDVGRVRPDLVEHLNAVDVLAIESNYCPRLQLASARPAFLKRRIMGGSGHLSNEQCGEAVRAIMPRRHVVLLHLSRECNRPTLAAAAHTGAPYSLTISSQVEPTGWIAIPAGSAPVEIGRGAAKFPASLFGAG